MSRRGKKASHGSRNPLAAESRSIELATHAWMLATITTLVCEIMTVLARAYVTWVDPEALAMQVLAGLLLFAALVLGTIALGLGVVVTSQRKHRPPRPVIVFALVVAIAPMIAALINLMR